MHSIFRFPATVNETSARLVATGVVVQGIAFLLLQNGLVLIPLGYGFLARVVSGPTLSPLGQFVTRVATPAIETRTRRLGRPVPGAPKRFAQIIGLTFTASAAAAWLVGAPIVSVLLILGLVAAAGLEAAVGICLGCIVYDAIWGCPECADISLRNNAVPAEASDHRQPSRV